MNRVKSRGWITTSFVVVAACATSTQPVNSPGMHPYYVNYMPFGAGQFQNGEPAKGAAFAIVECATLTTSASLWLYLSTAYANDHVPAADASTARRLQTIQMVSGFAFFATYAVGVVDALVQYRRRTRLTPTVIGSTPGLTWSWSR